MKTKYLIENSDDWNCVIEIDHDFKTIYDNKEYPVEDLMKEMILFFTGGEDRIERNDGNIIETFLEQLAESIYHLCAENSLYSVESLIDDFENMEGYCKMDGSMGIKIISTDDFPFNIDFSITKLID
jgi:hypothetical protein